MIKSFNIYCIVGILFYFLPALAQSSKASGTLLKYSFLDSYYKLGNNSIAIRENNEFGQSEIFVMINDTLVQLKNDSIFYYKPFNQNISSYDNSSISYQMCYKDRIVITLFDYPNQYWAYFYPESDSFITGQINFSSNYNFLTATNCNFYYTSILDTGYFFYEGIFESTEVYLDGWLIGYIGEGDSLFNLMSPGGYRSPTIIFSNTSEGVINSVFVGENIFTTGNPHGIYSFGTTNGGVTWVGEILMRGNIDLPVPNQISNRNLIPHLKNTTFLDGAMDDYGTLHLTLYGLGYSVQNGDTIETTPVLYWNSRDKIWIAVSHPDYEYLKDDFGNNLFNYSPVYNYGLSLPSISVSDDGQVVLVVWSSPEYNELKGLLKLNIYPGDNGPNHSPIYYTDYYANISYDGGKTWNKSNIFPIKNIKNLSESYLSLNKRLNFDYTTGRVKADFIYLVDEIPGNSNFGQNSVSSNPWYYDSLVIFTTRIVAQNNYPSVFKLSQNYPNPFNHSTTIEFYIPEKEKVKLIIYDLLGQQIEILLDEERNEGNHKINFNASNLASGVYFYSIEAGEFKAVRKMLLMK